MKIEKAQHITILSHLNPDADTLGTALGIYALLRKDKSKKIEVVNASNALPNYLDFLPYFKKIKYKMDYTNSLVISCDCGSIDRLGFHLDGRDIINIDHHKSNTMYGTINVVLPSYASASQVAYTLFKHLYAIDENSATCFYTALLSDTRYFTSSSVNEDVLSVAKELVALGARPYHISDNLTKRRPLSSLRILERALGSLRLKNDAKIAILSVTKDDIKSTGATASDMEGIADYAISLATVQIAIFAIELENTIRVSLRSKGVDVSKIAGYLGGGGHAMASGIILDEYTLSEAIEATLKVINSSEATI